MEPFDRRNSRNSRNSRKTSRAVSAMLGASLALGGLVACNQLLGTDKYSDGEDVPGDASALDGTATDGDTDRDTGPSKDAGIDVQIILPPGSQPATWAHWKMPDRLLPEGGTQPSYTAASATTVLDNVTLLIWQRDARGFTAGTPKFADAKAACDSLADGGEKWRVPTRIELVSLLSHDYDDAGALKNPAIDPIFTGTGNLYWTSSPVLPATEPLKFWLVKFDTGGLAKGTTAPYVRCVKAAP